MMALVTLSSAGWLMQDLVMTAVNETQYNQQVGSMMVALGYLPAVIMVLRRPNQGVDQQKTKAGDAVASPAPS
jgi:hypothetical protein